MTDTGIDHLAVIDLEPLLTSDAHRLVARAGARALGKQSPVAIERIVHFGGGNPLALELLSREWAERGEESVVGSLGQPGSVPSSVLTIPKAIQALVERQTDQLDERARAVLDLAAVRDRV